MMTIHELADLSGISVRALHYYDRIELLKPCCIEQNGYRKYDEASLRRLQQIMFYKEMDIPLKEIRDILNHPEFNLKEAIRYQKDLLTAKRDRLTRLIKLMERILEGDDEVDFSAFEHNEIEEVYRSRIIQMEPEFRQGIVELYGSVEAFIDRARKNKAKIEESATQHYGSVDKYLEVLRNAPFPKEGMGKLQLQLDHTLKKLASCKNKAVSNSEVQSLVCDWKNTFKMMLDKNGCAEKFCETFQKIYHSYMESKEIIKYMDGIYGEGATEFIGRAMEFNDNYNHNL